jgi:pyruvate dehydrogenase E1 component
MSGVPDLVALFVPQPFPALGTDGYGFSDTRSALRRHFEVDAPNIVVAVLFELAESGALKHEVVHEAIARYDLDPDKLDPRLS